MSATLSEALSRPARKRRRNHFVSGSAGVVALQWAFRVLGKVVPELGARAALRVFLTPPRLLPDGDWLDGLPAPQLRHLRLNGRKVVTYIWGQGPAVMLVHGWGLRATEMAHFVRPLLDRGCRVIALDGPSHGASEGKQIDFMEFAATLASVANEAGAPLAAVVAHSYGAACLLIAMRRYGLRAERAVLLGCPASAVWVTEDFGRRMAVPASVLERMRALLVATRGGDWTWQQMGAEELVAGLDVPALLVHDREDRIIPYEHALRISASNPNLELLTLSGIGHRRMLRDASTISRSVDYALGKLARRTA